MIIKFAIRDFLDDRKYNKNVTDSTITTYKYFLTQFEDFCHENEVINVEDIDLNIIKKFILDCRKKGNNATSTNSKLTRIRAFLNYMIECEVIKDNPAKRVKRAKEDIKINVFNDDQIRQMLNYFRRMRQRDKSFFAYRDYEIIVTFLGTGLRLSELCNLKWSDIDFKEFTLSVFGKNRQLDTIPITEKLIKELSAYKLFGESFFDTQLQYVFTDSGNKKISDNAVKNIFKRLSSIMNFKDVRVSAHTFRHTYCHKLAMSGMSAFAVQRMMRHRSIEVTMRYMAMWGIDLKEQNDAHNPLNNLDI